MVLDFLAVNNFDFTRKIAEKILGEKLDKNLTNSESLLEDIHTIREERTH